MPGVPEYDAFGREIGEDPLQGFRDPVAPRPEPAPVVAAPEPVEFVPPRRRRRRGSARLMVILAGLGVALYAVGSVGVKVEGGIQDVVDGFPSTTAPPATD